MTIEQKRAVAMASARMRLQQQASLGAPAQPSTMDMLRAGPLGGAAQTVMRMAQGPVQLAANLPSPFSVIDPEMGREKAAIAERVNRVVADQNRDYMQNKMRVAEASGNPRLFLAMTGTGEDMANLVNPYGTVGSGIANPIVRGMASASGFAASQPVLDPQANYWLEKAKQQAVAIPTGAITGALSAPPKIPAPSTAEIKKTGQGIYKSIENEPVPVTPEMLSAVQDRAGQTAIRNAVNDARINRETALADELNSLLSADPAKIPSQISANAADKLSQSFRDLGSAAMRADRGNASRGWFGRRNDIESALTSVPDVKAARKVWSQYEKSKLIDETIQAAKDNYITPGGTADLNQALRREFGKLVRNDEAMASLDAAEQDAIKRVANGTFTANTLQRIGKFSPIRNHLSAIVDIGAAIGGHAAMGGMKGTLPALALAGVGEGARLAGIAATQRNAALASELIRRGPAAFQPALPGPAPNVPVGNLTNALVLQALLRAPRVQ